MVVHIPVRILPGPPLASIAPIYERLGKRDEYPPQMNESASQIDRVVEDPNDPRPDPRDNKMIAKGTIDPFPTEAEFVAKYRQMIGDHIDQRVSCFFLQAVICYKTGYHYEMTEAQDQGKSASGLHLRSTDGRHSIQSLRNAAHSSTLPSLIAFDPEAWAQRQGGVFPPSFSLGKGTDAYRRQNTTMNMPRWINQADIDIDGTSVAPRLRTATLALINRLSTGEISPQTALGLFLQQAIHHVDLAIARRPHVGKGSHERQVLTYYREDLLAIQTSFRARPQSMIRRFLDIEFDPNETEEACRRAIYQLRYQAIRDATIAQGKILKEIDAASKRILAGYPRKPDHFNAAFRTLLVGQDPRLKKLYNFSPEFFQTTLRGQSLGKFQTTLALLQRAHLPAIQRAAQQALAEMDRLRVEETRQRGKTIRTLRTSKGWSQTRLGQELRAVNPTAPTSQKTMSRVERGEKPVTPPIAQDLSRALRIPVGLLLPQFLWS